MNRELGRTEELAIALNDLSHGYRDSSRFAEAEAAGREASELLRAIGNKPMLADSLSTRGQALLCVGDYEAVLSLTDEARRLSEETGNLWGPRRPGRTRTRAGHRGRDRTIARARRITRDVRSATRGARPRRLGSPTAHPCSEGKG